MSHSRRTIAAAFRKIKTLMVIALKGAPIQNVPQKCSCFCFIFMTANHSSDIPNIWRTFEIKDKSWCILPFINSYENFNLICRGRIHMPLTNIISTQCHCNTYSFLLDIGIYKTTAILLLGFKIGDIINTFKMHKHIQNVSRSYSFSLFDCM